MKELNKIEMQSTIGGADPVLIAGIVTIVVTFISGILNGIASPKKCN